MEKTKILLIHPEARSYRSELFNLISKQYNTKIIFTWNGKNAKNLKDSKNWNFKYIKTFKFIGYNSISPEIIIESFKNYDIIISSGLGSFSTHISFLIAKITKKKIILWDETWDWPKTIWAKIAKPYVKLIVKHADACIAAGSKAKELYLKFGANEKKIFIAPNNAINLNSKKINLKKKEEIKKKLGLKNKKIILYLSRIVEYKGLDFLIKSFEKIEKVEKNAFLLIGGEGNFKKKCENIAKKKIVNYKFIGKVDHSKISEFYNICDVFVLPSRRIENKNECSEAWGLVLNEVMSIGKPVISTTAVGGAFDLIKNNLNGFIIKEKSIYELKKAIQKILKNKKTIKNMSDNSLKIIKNFTPHKQFNGFKNAIEYLKK